MLGEAAKLKKILILSAENTGHGHKSITQSLMEQYEMRKLPVEAVEIDSFELGGFVTRLSGKLYNGVAVYAPFLWKLIYKGGDVCPGFINAFVTLRIKKNILELIKEHNPDMIVSVHPCFIGAVNNILEKNKINIPVISFVADFDNVSHLWADKRTHATLCPTEKAKKTMLQLGIPEERLKLFGFPARDRFNHYNENNDEVCADGYDPANKSISFMIMNGSQGTSAAIKMARVLLDNVKNSKVTILAGRSKALKKLLEETLKPKYGDRVQILGFVENVQDYMCASDILILRASPNVVTEAVNLCRPIIVTGSLMGQEEKNPDFVADNNLGIVCRKIKNLPKAVDVLLADDGKKLNEIRESQMAFRKTKAASDIAEYIYEVMESFSSEKAQ
jgi:processive 1,2-diacylglycerol beta-glucosyltransferase